MSTPNHIFAVIFVAVSVNSVSLNAAMVDPTRPPTWGSVSAKPRAATIKRRGLQLQTTLVSPGRRMAIINGRSYSVGSRVGKATIVEIKPFEVVLEKAGKKTKLRLLPRVNRSPAAANRNKK